MTVFGGRIEREASQIECDALKVRGEGRERKPSDIGLIGHRPAQATLFGRRRIARSGSGFHAPRWYSCTRGLAAQLHEARVVAALRSLGGELEDQPTDAFGTLLPAAGLARYRFAVRLRNPSVTDEHLAMLDEFDADRVASLDLLNCAVGDVTLARAGRFQRLTLLGLGQARNSIAEPWPTGPAGLLTEAGFVHLARLPDLQTVGLHGPDVTDRALVHPADAGSFAS